MDEAKPKKVIGKPFKKKDPETGEVDPRSNMKGRKFGPMAFRRLAKEVAAEIIKSDKGDVNGMMRAELLLRAWADPTAHPSLQMQFVKYVAGNPDQRVRLSGAVSNITLNATDTDTEQLKAKLMSLADFEITLEELREDEVDAD